MAKGMDPRIKELMEFVITSGIPWSVTGSIDTLSFKVDEVWYRADIWADNRANKSD